MALEYSTKAEMVKGLIEICKLLKENNKLLKENNELLRMIYKEMPTNE